MSAPNYEQLKNGPQTTLNGSILSGATSLIVTSAAGFPTVGNFRILIDSEIFLVTAVSTNTFTVTPGQEGTTQAAHSNLANVTHVFTQGAAHAFRADSLLNDTFANRPSAGVLGRIFIPSNSDILCYDDGSVWQHFGPVQQLTQPPLAASFSTAATHAGTATDDSGTIFFTGNVQSGWNISDQYIAKPSTPFTITANFGLQVFANNNSGGDFAGCGIHIRDSASGKIVCNCVLFEGADTVQMLQSHLIEFSGFTAINADEITGHGTSLNPDNIWIRYTDNGTNRIYSLSNDGQNWTQIDSRANSTYVPATYDQVGFHVITNTSAWYGQPACKLRSWKQT